MANLDDVFPSKYLKESDLRGQAIAVTIRDIIGETVGEDRRMVAYFQGKKKGLVLNKTNAYKIGDMYGRDTDHWLGKAIEVYPSETDYQGKTVPCIRVRAPQQITDPRAGQSGPVLGQSLPPPTQPEVQRVPAEPEDFEDEIPF